MKRPLAFALSVLITTSVVAQTESASPKPKTGRHSSSAPVSKTLEDMKNAISAQQQQIQQLQQQIQGRDQAIQQLQQQVSQAQSTAQQAQETANAAVPKADDLDKQYMDPLQHDVADLKTVSGNTVNELQETQKRVNGLESPLAIHYKGVTITPGAFLAAETAWRSHALTADVNTPFNTIPFGGASNSRRRNSLAPVVSHDFPFWFKANWPASKRLAITRWTGSQRVLLPTTIRATAT